jgi:geranylgeranyl diphosphate synthase type II
VAEGKFTVLMAYASRSPHWPQISSVMQAGTPAADKAARIRDLLEACGARAKVEELAASYADQVRDLLAASRLPPGLRSDLGDLLELAVRRLR